MKVKMFFSDIYESESWLDFVAAKNFWIICAIGKIQIRSLNFVNSSRVGPTKISPYLGEQIPFLTESFDFVFSWTLSSPPSHGSQIGNDRVE